MTELIFPVSPEQEEVLADHFLLGTEMGVQPDERAWIRAKVCKLAPGKRILSADMDIENGTWRVTVQE